LLAIYIVLLTWFSVPLRLRPQNHIQLAILNPNCIKAVFLPRNKEDILKHDRDLKNITDTARDEGRLEGLKTAALAMYKNGLAVDFIAQTLNISLEAVKSWMSTEAK
jgi:hypothetical protein